MSTKEVEQLEERAWKGSLTPDDVRKLGEMLANPEHSRDLVALLKIAGLGHALMLKPQVESFLSPSHRPMVFASALGTLTAYWGLAQDYRDIVLAAVKGHHWDVDRDVQRRGLIAAADLLEAQPDPELLEAVIGVAELQETNAEEDIPIPGTRRRAIQTLDRIVTPEWEHMTPLARHQVPGPEAAALVLRRARQLLAEQRGAPTREAARTTSRS